LLFAAAPALSAPSPPPLFFPAPATPDIYTLSLHDALPIFRPGTVRTAQLAVPLAGSCWSSGTDRGRRGHHRCHHRGLPAQRAQLWWPGGRCLRLGRDASTGAGRGLEGDRMVRFVHVNTSLAVLGCHTAPLCISVVLWSSR